MGIATRGCEWGEAFWAGGKQSLERDSVIDCQRKLPRKNFNHIRGS